MVAWILLGENWYALVVSQQILYILAKRVFLRTLFILIILLLKEGPFEIIPQFETSYVFSY
jgi:hypothetical protein